ncbi:MAG: glycosyltransferase family 2 protein [Parcubacteria group bacterium]|nr:glycosyltransferase family 2 protein [Parcubacteria group bacterium]
MVKRFFIDIKDMQLSTIIVNYNTRDDLKEALQSLQGQGITDSEVIVVDNASTDGSVEALTELEAKPHLSRLNLKVIANQTNLGFAKAVNQGLRIARGEFILLLNPDVRFQGRALSTMIQYVRDHPHVASVGPKIIYPDGRLQPSRGTFPTLAKSLASLFRIKSLLPPDERMIQMAKGRLGRIAAQWGDPEATQEVDFTTGACLLIRRSLFDTIGTFDERFFLYYEEIDFFLRAHEAGFRHLYLPAAVVVHTVGTSSKKIGLSSYRYRYESMIKYFMKHKPWWQTFVIRVAIVLKSLGSFMVSVVLLRPRMTWLTINV